MVAAWPEQGMRRCVPGARCPVSMARRGETGPRVQIDGPSLAGEKREGLESERMVGVEGKYLTNVCSFFLSGLAQLCGIQSL